jgi:hypothetical protein
VDIGTISNPAAHGARPAQAPHPLAVSRQTEMKTPNFILRLLTLLTYFLPFIFFLPTCTDMLTLEQAYNKSDAIKNVQKKSEYELSVFESLLDSISDNSTKNSMDEVRTRTQHFFPNSNQLKYLDQDFQYYLIMPTDHSLSGIGAVYFHKNILGKTSIAISLGLSLITLLLWTFLDRKGFGTYILIANILVLGVFILTSIFSDVSVLFGTWTLLFLLVSQLLTKDRRATANR